MGHLINQIINFPDISRKLYSNGRTGDYINTCYLCHKLFIGHKHDYTCPDCENPGSELNKAGEREND